MIADGDSILSDGRISSRMSHLRILTGRLHSVELTQIQVHSRASNDLYTMAGDLYSIELRRLDVLNRLQRDR